MSPPLKDTKHVPVLSDDELVALLKTCNGKTFDHRRDEVSGHDESF